MMQIARRILIAALACGAPLASGQELKVWRLANPTDTSAVGSVEGGVMESGPGPSSFYVRFGSPENAMEAGVYLGSNAKATATTVASGIRVEISAGSAVVHYTATGAAKMPLVIVTKESWIRLQPDGMIRVEVAADSTKFLLARGKAEKFSGAPPAGSPAGVEGGQALTVDSAVNDRAKLMIAGLNASGAAGWAIDWIGRAERGDLAPTERFSPPSTGTYVVRTTGVVTPRTASVTTPPQSSAAPAVAGGFSAAQALLASQNPASVVVGARLERTRIVGSPGTQGGSGIQFNTQARPPLRLGATLP